MNWISILILFSTTIIALAQDTAMPSVLVLGATGATGKQVVRQLLDSHHKVSVIVRSKERMLAAIEDNPNKNMLSITEAASLQPDDLTDAQLQQHVQAADIVVSCLGHTLDAKGIWGHPRRLVTDAVKRFADKKFILMVSDGVAHPNDNPRAWYERALLFVLRHVIPPHADNEEAAAYLLDQAEKLEWIVVRPTVLIETDAPTPYTIYDKPLDMLFGGGEVSRSTVAKFMVDLITDESLWSKYKHQMPVLHNTKTEQKDEL